MEEEIKGFVIFVQKQGMSKLLEIYEETTEREIQRIVRNMSKGFFYEEAPFYMNLNLSWRQINGIVRKKGVPNDEDKERYFNNQKQNFFILPHQIEFIWYREIDKNE